MDTGAAETSPSQPPTTISCDTCLEEDPQSEATEPQQVEEEATDPQQVEDEATEPLRQIEDEATDPLMQRVEEGATEPRQVEEEATEEEEEGVDAETSRRLMEQYFQEAHASDLRKQLAHKEVRQPAVCSYHT